jgi:hypothetical protein
MSRLKNRRSCDFSTLQSLAEVVGASIGVLDEGVPFVTSGQFPAAIDRDYEEKLFELCASGDLNPERWRRAFWLERSPIQPSRFLPPLADRRRAA